MTREEFISVVSHNNELVPKRCTESWLKKHNLISVLDNLTDQSFGSYSERIKHVKYGGGWCAVCGVRTNLDPTGNGFNKHCYTHFKADAIGKPAHNRASINVSEVLYMYYVQKLTIIEIAERYNFSNVTLSKRLKKAGFELRTHQENQYMHSRRGYKKPRIIIDRKILVNQYINLRTSMRILAKEYNCHTETIRRFLAQEGVHQRHRQSYLENILSKILTKNNINFVANSYKLIPPKQIDFYLSDFNIGIECNGHYTHSFSPGDKAKDYHHSKYIEATNRGIRLFQFWEEDIRDKPEIVESIILNACGLNLVKIDARKCTVADITCNQLADFCDKNHLQGAPAKNVKGVGLYNNDVLVSVMGFTESRSHTTIQRFCSVLGYNVRGGFSKLVSAIPGNTIKTYSSNDISNGSLYEKNGFVMTADRKYDMWYTDFKNLFNREKYMKIKLPKLLDFFDESKTEQENMINNGFGIIYKSGTKTWVLNR